MTPCLKHGLPRKARRKNAFTLKINASTFDPNKLQLHYVNVVIKIGNELVNTDNIIINKITYNGRKCNLKWKSSNNQEFETIIWHKSPFIYNYCGCPAEGLIEAELNDRWGYINTKGCDTVWWEMNTRNSSIRNLSVKVQFMNHWTTKQKKLH